MALKVDAAHLGTTEAAWLGSPRLAACAPMSAAAWGAPSRVVVVAPHPDDEVFGIGGTLMQLARQGSEVAVVAVTDGEASHPRSRTVSREALRARRADERSRALGALGLGGSGAAKVIRLGIPDGAVACADRLAELLVPELEGAALCLAPWERDGHPDHDAAGRAASTACSAAGVRLVRYLVWAWHWTDPGANDLPWDRLRRVPLSPEDVNTKRAAIAAYRSQIAALGPEPGDEAILPPAVLERFERTFEAVIV